MSDEGKFEAFKQRTVAHNEEVYGAEIRAKHRGITEPYVMDERFAAYL